jgi:site-specific DNA recombinase
LEDADFIRRKAFLRSFVKRITIEGDTARIQYRLPLPSENQGKERLEKVLPIIPLGGAGGIRTPYLLTASQTFSQVNYGPADTFINLPEIRRQGKPQPERV